MKKVILWLGELLLDYGSLLYLLFIIYVAVSGGSIFILFMGLVALVITLFLLYLLIDIKDKLCDANETLTNLLLVLNGQSFSLTGIKEDTGAINSILTDDPKLFENMNTNLISINNILNRQLTNISNASTPVVIHKEIKEQAKQDTEEKQNIESETANNIDNT